MHLKVTWGRLWAHNYSHFSALCHIKCLCSSSKTKQKLTKSFTLIFLNLSKWGSFPFTSSHYYCVCLHVWWERERTLFLWYCISLCFFFLSTWNHWKKILVALVLISYKWQPGDCYFYILKLILCFFQIWSWALAIDCGQEEDQHLGHVMIMWLVQSCLNEGLQWSVTAVLMTCSVVRAIREGTEEST